MYQNIDEKYPVNNVKVKFIILECINIFTKEEPRQKYNESKNKWLNVLGIIFTENSEKKQKISTECQFHKILYQQEFFTKF